MRSLKLTFTALILFLSALSYAQTTVLLKGSVVGRDSDTLMLLPRSGSLRQDNKIMYIPIRDNKFEYKFTAPQQEAYQLIFLEERNKGVWNTTILFPDTSEIRLTLFDMPHFDNNVVTGGSLNREYYNYKKMDREKFQAVRDMLLKKTISLDDAGKYRSKEYRQAADSLKGKSAEDRLPLYERMEFLTKTGKHLTDEGLKIQSSADSLNNLAIKWRYGLIRKDITLNNYFLMWYDVQNIARDRRDVAFLINTIYPAYAARFPDHIYTKLIGNSLGGLVQIYPGNKFVDFTAPTVDGRQVNLTESIKGKLAVIDLWGSWCGPCIAKAKLMVPIYHKYKDKGFTVLGVAREFKNLDALKHILKQEKFPWTNLVELDDQNKIWNKYSAGDGGGMQVLVDKNGIVLIVNPTAEEVEAAVKQYISLK